MFEFVRIDYRWSSGTPAGGRGHSTGMGGPFCRIGSFHLGEEREHHHGQLSHRAVWVRGIDGERISQRADTYPTLFELVHQV